MGQRGILTGSIRAFHLGRSLVKKDPLGTKSYSPVVKIKYQCVCQCAMKYRYIITKMPLINSSPWPRVAKVYF